MLEIMILHTPGTRVYTIKNRTAQTTLINIGFYWLISNVNTIFEHKCFGIHFEGGSLWFVDSAYQVNLKYTSWKQFCLSKQKKQNRLTVSRKIYLN
jgi:hypothetical protein